MTEKEKETNIPSLDEHHYYMFSGEVNNESVSDVIKFIIARNLMVQRPKAIKLIINSFGGDVSAAFSLIDVMQGSKVPVYTYGLGEILSSGLSIFMAGEAGHRYITKNTAILSHQYTWGSFGKQHELMASVKEFTNVHCRILNHYKKCTGLSEKDIKKYLLPAEDVWLTSKEAVKYGIADKVIDTL